MVMVVLVSSGYCRIGSFHSDWSPISRISRLTTVARTGRLMKMSVKRMSGLFRRSRHLGLGERAVVDPDLGALRQLQLADNDHQLARLDALIDRHPVIAGLAGSHEAALDLVELVLGCRLAGRRSGGLLGNIDGITIE